MHPKRSGGCAACRRQKLKCDEVQPICSRCLRLGRECVYPARHQFIDENSKFDLSSKPTVQTTGKSSSETKLNLLYTKGDHNGLVHKFQLVNSRSASAEISQRSSVSPLPTLPSLSEPDMLGLALTYALENVSGGYQLQCLGDFTLRLPSRLGVNRALDAAVACFLQGHSRLLGGFSSFSSGVQPSIEYMKALRTLREVIEDPILGPSSETMCATLLMAYYEMIVKEKSGSRYIAHAGGASKLILLRGPKAISTDFERDLLRAQRGRVILEAFLRREHCFLLDDGWRDIQLEKSQKFESIMLDQLLRCFSRIPSFVKHAYDWKTGSTASTIEQIREEGISLQSELSSISTMALIQDDPNNDLAFEVVSSCLSDNMFPISLRFTTREGAIFHTWCCAASLIIYLGMGNTLVGYEQQPEVSDAIRQICMSYEYAASLKPLGAQFIQLPLIVAYLFSNEKVKVWILQSINSLTEEIHIVYTREYVEIMAASIVGNLK